MVLKYAEETDRAFVRKLDPHIEEEAFQAKSLYVIWKDAQPAGILSYCMLWDHLPFLNLIYLEEPYRVSMNGNPS